RSSPRHTPTRTRATYRKSNAIRRVAINMHNENSTNSVSTHALAINSDKELSGARFMDDPLASVSARLPLTPPGFSVPDRSEAPSGPDTRHYDTSSSAR